MIKKTFIIILLLSTFACTKHVVAPVPGQLNVYDAYAYRVLADAQAAISDFRNSVTSGKLAESPDIKTALNQAISDYNTANVAYQAWHAAGGTASTTTITAQLNALQADINNVAVQAGGKK